MEEDNKKNEIIKAITRAEFYPSVLPREDARLEERIKIPYGKLFALGTATEPLAAVFQKIVQPKGVATGGIYRVTIPNSISGGHLAKFGQESHFMGSVLDGGNQVAGQARLDPLVCNPTMLFMAAALWSIDKKLERLQETQKEILEFLESKERAKLRGNLNFLTDVLNNYKFNWANEKYKSSNHIKVLDIKQGSEQSILFYREQIERFVKKKVLLHSDKDVRAKLEKMKSEFQEYNLALYLFAFSSFLEVLLLENFESLYLDGVVSKIEKYSLRYDELYAECLSQIKNDSKSSIQSHLIGGLSIASKAGGNVIAKIPIVSKSQIDETLIEVSNRLGDFQSQRTTKTMKKLENASDSAIYLFVDNINTINRLFNQPMDLLFDEENLYFSVMA